jgi:hypothetical protein
MPCHGRVAGAILFTMSTLAETEKSASRPSAKESADLKQIIQKRGATEGGAGTQPSVTDPASVGTILGGRKSHGTSN